MLEFDLTGARTISEEFLQALGDHMRFEYILSYVSLPNINSHSNIKDGSVKVLQRLLLGLRIGGANQATGATAKGSSCLTELTIARCSAGCGDKA